MQAGMQTAVEEAFFLFICFAPFPIHMCMLYLQREEVIQGKNDHLKNRAEGGKQRQGLRFAQHQEGAGQVALLFFWVQRDDGSIVRLQGEQAEQRRAIQGRGKGNLNLIVLHPQRRQGCCRAGVN